MSDRLTGSRKKRTVRRPVKVSYVGNRDKRMVRFSKRKNGMFKKAFELHELTGAECMVLVVSDTAHVHTFATRRLRPILKRRLAPLRYFTNERKSKTLRKFLKDHDIQLGDFVPDDDEDGDEAAAPAPADDDDEDSSDSEYSDSDSTTSSLETDDEEEEEEGEEKTTVKEPPKDATAVAASGVVPLLSAARQISGAVSDLQLQRGYQQQQQQQVVLQQQQLQPQLQPQQGSRLSSSYAYFPPMYSLPYRRSYGSYGSYPYPPPPSLPPGGRHLPVPVPVGVPVQYRPHPTPQTHTHQAQARLLPPIRIVSPVAGAGTTPTTAAGVPTATAANAGATASSSTTTTTNATAITGGGLTAVPSIPPPRIPLHVARGGLVLPTLTAVAAGPVTVSAHASPAAGSGGIPTPKGNILPPLRTVFPDAGLGDD